MNIAVIADIHGDYRAFKAAVDYLENREIDAYFLLGDYIGEYPRIIEIFDLIYELQKKYPCYIVKGNREDYLLKGIGAGHPEWEQYKSTVGMIKYANDTLRKKDFELIRSMPVSLKVSFKGMEDIRICHGSPRKTNEPVWEEQENMKKILEEVPEKYLLCGHIHRKREFHEYGKHIFNPGSVSEPMDDGKHDKLSFMILHSVGQEWEAEQIYLDADRELSIQDMIDYNVPEIAPYWAMTAEAYLKGAQYENGSVLERAMEIGTQIEGECNWPEIDERYWQQAFKERIIDIDPNIYEKMRIKCG